MMHKVCNELFSPNKPLGLVSYYVQTSICVAYYICYWVNYNPFLKYLSIKEILCSHFLFTLKSILYVYLCYRLIILVIRRLKPSGAKLIFILPVFIPLIWVPFDLLGFKVRLWALYILFVGTLE